MVSSFVVSIVFFILKKTGHAPPFAHIVLYSVGFTTLCWLITAYLGAPTSRERLIAFYRKVRPAGPGWAAIRAEAAAGEAPGSMASGDRMGLATLGWISGCLTIWSSLFAIGNFLYGRMPAAWILTAVFIISGGVLLHVCSHLWDRSGTRDEPKA